MSKRTADADKDPDYSQGDTERERERERITLYLKIKNIRNQLYDDELIRTEIEITKSLTLNVLLPEFNDYVKGLNTEVNQEMELMKENMQPKFQNRLSEEVETEHHTQEMMRRMTEGIQHEITRRMTEGEGHEITPRMREGEGHEITQRMREEEEGEEEEKEGEGEGEEEKKKGEIQREMEEMLMKAELQIQYRAKLEMEESLKGQDQINDNNIKALYELELKKQHELSNKLNFISLLDEKALDDIVLNEADKMQIDQRERVRIQKDRRERERVRIQKDRRERERVRIQKDRRESERERESASPTLQILGYINKFTKMLEDFIIYNTYAQIPLVRAVEPRPTPLVRGVEPPPIQLSDPVAPAPDIDNATSMVLYCYLHGGKEILKKKYSIFIVTKLDMQVILITNALRGEVTVAVRSTRYLSYYEMSGLGEGGNMGQRNAGYQNYRKYGSFNNFKSRISGKGIINDKNYNYIKNVIPPGYYPYKQSVRDLLFVFYIISTFRSIIHKIFPIQDPTHPPAMFNDLVDEYIIKNPEVITKPTMMQMLIAIRVRGMDSSRLTAVNTNKYYWLGPPEPTDLTQEELNYPAYPVIIKNILNVNTRNSILNDVTYNQKPSLSLRNKGFQPDYPYNDKCFKADYRLTRTRHDTILKLIGRATAFEYNARGRIDGILNHRDPDPTKNIQFDITNPANVYNTAIMILMLNDYLKHGKFTDADLGFTFPHGTPFYSPRDICVVYDIQFTIPRKINEFTAVVFEQRHVVIRAGETFLANPHIVEYFIKIYDCLITLRPIYDKEKCLNDTGFKHYDVGGKYAAAPDPTDPQPIPFIPEGSTNYVYKVFLQDATLLQIIRFCEHAGITKFIMNDNSCDTLTVEDDNTITVMETQALTRIVTGYDNEQEKAIRDQLLGIEPIPESVVLTPRTASPPSSPRSPGGGASRHRFMHHALSTGKNIIMNANKIMNVGKNMLVKSVGKINSTNKSHRLNSYRSSNHDTSVKAASSTSKVAKRTRRRRHQPRRKTRKV
jgi:hypothetical protein